MEYDNDLVAAKLRRWEKYLNNYRLPKWEDIPNFGLYMEQMIELLKQYLDYLPPELKEEQFITAATINNYVRTKVMPEPRKKRYYRPQIAYLIIILTLKQSLSLAMIQRLIPYGLSDEELEKKYMAYATQHNATAQYFTEQIRTVAAPILKHDNAVPISTDRVEDLITMNAILGGFTRLFAEKLLLLQDKAEEEAKKAEAETGKAKAETGKVE